MTIVDYRCVCGGTTSLETETGGECRHCRRKYAAEALRGALADTVSIADLSRPEKAVSMSAAATSADDRLGKAMGHFRILRRLGGGGMGEVYQALDESLERYVALKVIRSTVTTVSDTPRLHRLLEEAIAQARVNHPHVVQIYYVGRDHDSPFLAMELVGGPNLAERLEQGPLSFAKVIRLAIELADALRACLHFDIVHGDIKPGNILLTDSGAAKLSDFGLATRLSAAAGGSGGVFGTPDYLAPELTAGRPPDMRSDMYALGVTLFEMTFGRPPYSASGSSVKQRMDMHRYAAIEFPEPWPAEVPMAWRSVLARLLAKSPDQRFASYDELLSELRSLRPMAFPDAGRLQRGLAWMVDLGLAAGAQAILTAVVPLLSLSFLPAGKLITALVRGVVAAAAPLLFAAVQGHWGVTPGKRLFQIRIVDRHGLRPDTTVLTARAAAQALPLWGVVCAVVMGAFGMLPVGIMLLVLTYLATLFDAGVAILCPRRRSVHDRFFDTRVVLDARLKETPGGR